MREQEKDRITEAASKKKRGRPRVIDDAPLQIIADHTPNIKTHRGRQELVYAFRAVTDLAKDKRFDWLTDEEHPIKKKGILSELGRIENEEDLKAVALQICELKPNVKEGAAMVRRWRTGKAPKADCRGLRSHMLKSVNAYLYAHPDTPIDMLVRVLHELAETVQEQFDEGKE